MKKTDLIKYIEALPSYKGIVESKTIPDTNTYGDNLYTATVRLIKGNILTYIAVEYVVINEGTKDEEAYFVNREPKV